MDIETLKEANRLKGVIKDLSKMQSDFESDNYTITLCYLKNLGVNSFDDSFLVKMISLVVKAELQAQLDKAEKAFKSLRT